MSAGDVGRRGNEKSDCQPVGQRDGHQSCRSQLVTKDTAGDHNRAGTQKYEQQRGDEFSESDALSGR